MDPVAKAKQTIEAINYITLATVTEEGKPWNSPVYAAHDKAHNFFWCSWLENQHSKNILANGQIFIVIYDSTAQEGFGVYIEAEAQVLDSKEQLEEVPNDLYVGPNHVAGKQPYEYLLGDFPRRVFKAVPETCWVNQDSDIDGNFIDTRTEIKLL